jgi:hypothetical protein
MGLTDVQKAKTRPTVNNLFGTDARIFVRLKTLGSGVQDLQIMVQSLRVVEDKLGSKTQLRERLAEPLRGLKTQVVLIDPEVRQTDEHKQFRFFAVEF